MKLADVIEELVEERGLDRGQLGDIVCKGILSAYQRKHPEAILKVDYNETADEAVVMVEKEVVSSVSDDEKEISLKNYFFGSCAKLAKVRKLETRANFESGTKLNDQERRHL